MPKVDLVIDSAVSQSQRARSLEAMFDVPPQERQRLSWSINVPLKEKQWSVGAILGASGSGKSTIAKHLWPDEMAKTLCWKGDSVIDDFDSRFGIDEIAACCAAVGFNTIPAWLRPFNVLSTGERFRVELARRLLEAKEITVIDEFTSVVDRQVARIGCHAVQKYVRKQGKQLVAVACHDDIVDWLQPDWVLRADTQTFQWRSVQPRPRINVTIEPCSRSHWATFSRFHYLTASVRKGANFSLLRVDGVPAAICAWFRFPTNKTGPKIPVMRLSRTVVLPDYQGLGLAFVLTEFLGSIMSAVGIRLHACTAHAGYIRSRRRSPNWLMVKDSTPRSNGTSAKAQAPSQSRPAATFRYVGPKAEPADAYKHMSAFGDKWWCRLPKWKRAEQEYREHSHVC